MAIGLVSAANDTYRQVEMGTGRSADSRAPLTPAEKKAAEKQAAAVEISQAGRLMADPSGKASGIALSEDEQRKVRELEKIDREVRAHEQAHMAAGGGLVRGGATFQYRSGPDGKLYAVGGEVSIDTSAIPNDPDATARKAARIRAAALAPSNPSPQDRSVAAEAAAMETRAAAERRQTSTEKSTGAVSAPTAGAAAMAYSAPSGSLKSGPALSQRAVDA